MIIYLVGDILSIFFSYLYMKEDKSKKKVLYFILSLLPFLIISCIRYDVGTDYTYRYYTDYNRLKAGQIPDYEILFFKFMNFIAQSHMPYQTIFIATSFCIIIPIYVYIFKYCENPTNSITIFFFCGYFFESLNILRQYICCAILLFAFEEFIKGKNLRFILMVIICCLIHKASIIVLPIFYICNIKKINIKNMCYILFISYFIILLFKPLIYNLIAYTPYKTYLTGKNNYWIYGDFQVVQSCLNIIISVFMMYFYKRNMLSIQTEKLTKIEFLVKLQLFTLFFVC